MKAIFYTLTITLLFFSCSKEESNPPTSGQNTITTMGNSFVPSTLNCNVGDTIYFELGSSHNAIEVSEANYNANSSNPITNGFAFDYGESGYIVVNEAKTHYYVCTPHLPEMKARIIVE